MQPQISGGQNQAPRAFGESECSILGQITPHKLGSICPNIVVRTA